MKPDFEDYNAAYTTRSCEIDSGIKLGRGAAVTLTDISTRPAKVRHRSDGVTIVATFTVALDVFPQKVVCDGCDVAAPGPEDDHDALMYLLENQDDCRLVWADANDDDLSSDHYPVKGWRRSGDKLLCPDCIAAIDALVKARRAATRAKR